MNNLPKCEVCINMALYLHYYVDYDIDKDKYISYVDTKERNKKIELVDEMFCFDDYPFHVSLEELEWLYNVEEDIKVKKVIKKYINRFSR